MSSAGAVLGPVLGDLIANNIGVIVVFLLPIPFCFTALMCIRHADNVIVKPDQKVDVPMHLAYIIGVSLVVFAVFNINSNYFIPMLIAGVAMLVLFLFLHHRSENKVVTPEVLHNKVFMFALVMGLLYNLVIYSLMDMGNIIPAFIGGDTVIFGTVVSLSFIGALSVSIKNLLQTLLSPPAGNFMKNHPADYCFIGFVLMALPVVTLVAFLSFFQVSDHPEIVLLMAVLLAASYIFFMPTNKKTMMSSVSKEERNFASSMVAVVSQVSGVTGNVALSNLLGGSDKVVSAAALNNAYFTLGVFFLFVVAFGIIVYVVQKRIQRKRVQSGDS